MTSGNGFGVNEEHVAASFRFIVKPSSGKTRLMNNIKLRLFIPPGLGQVVESERNENEREKKIGIDILCLLLEAFSEYCVLRNFFLTPLGDQLHTSLQLGSITTSLFLFQCHSPPLLTTTLGTQWAMWISAAGGAGKGKARCQCSVQFLNRSCR